MRVLNLLVSSAHARCLLLLLSVFGVAACRSAKQKAEAVDDYTLTMALDKNVYRPGESVVIRVKLVNNTKKTANVRALDADSLDFYFGRVGDPERMKRRAVTSTKDPVSTIVELTPGGELDRQFLLTRLTHFNGPLVAQAHYDPNPPQANAMNKLYSNFVTYQVTGEPLFERDPEGNLTKKEAIRVAQGLAPGEVKGADAVMVEDTDTGTNMWWVNVKLAVPGQGETLKSWLINPYTGKVKGEAHPFAADLAKDPRRVRPPAGAPKSPTE